MHARANEQVPVLFANDNMKKEIHFSVHAQSTAHIAVPHRRRLYHTELSIFALLFLALSCVCTTEPTQ
jgi:hypothetical protein